MKETVNIALRDPLNIQLQTENFEYLKALKKQFTYLVDGYYFTPAYRSGRWNGKTCLIRADNSMPYGLLTELIRVHKKKFSKISISVNAEVKALFKGKKLDIVEDLSLKPYIFQRDCIEKALRYTKGIIRSATASGKGLIIAYILKTLLENNLSDRCMIVVPNQSLVEQFYGDMEDYGVSKKWKVGRVYSKYKEWNNNIVIATWQTVKNNHSKMSMYNSIVIDECVDGNTKISTPTGNKKIKDIKIGDTIISYNRKNKIFEKDHIKNIYKNSNMSDNEDMYELSFDNGVKLKITGNHKILTKRGYIRTDKLTEFDEIINLDSKI